VIIGQWLVVNLSVMAAPCHLPLKGEAINGDFLTLTGAYKKALLSKRAVCEHG
jgi:hypothetical protein